MSTFHTEFAIIADARKSSITEVAEAHAEVQVTPLTKVELCLTVLAVLAILGFMHAAGAFLVPLLFAILISYTLSPAVAMLERLRMPRGLGAVLMLSLVSTAIVALCYSLSSDVGKLTDLVPRAASKVRELVRDQGGPASKPLANLQKAAKELEKAAAEATGETGAALRSRAAPAEGSVAHDIQQ